MTTQASTEKAGKGRFKLLKETIGELRKVVWLSRSEAAYLTLMVIVISGIVGIVLGALDFGFTQLVDKVIVAGG